MIDNKTNFTAGELSPRMKGLTDVAKYANGAEVIENGIVTVHGGVIRRWGKRYLATQKYGTTRTTRLIRYVFNVEQSYCLEFGHNYVRVFDGSTGAVILDGSLAPLEIVSPYTEAQLSGVRTRQNGDVLFLYHAEVAPQQLQRLSATQWVLIPAPFIVQPFAEIGHQPAGRLSLSAATVGAGRTFSTAAATAPNAPTIGVAVPLNASARVNFTPPADAGGSAITGYTATSSPGGFTGTSTGGPIIVAGLTNGVAYTFTVTATNAFGTSAASAASGAVTPLASLQSQSITVTADTTDFFTSEANGTALGIAGPTASGTTGTGPYTYAWTKVSGDADIVITRANAATAEFKSTGFGETNFATFRCQVYDSLGAPGSINVNVRVRHANTAGGVPL